MAFVFENDGTSLNQIFHYESPTHSFDVKWRSLGDSDSPPLVLIHGTPWSSRVWTPFALALSRQFHVYIFDRPGFGETPSERKLPGTEADSSKVIEFDADLARQADVYAALFRSWQADWGDQKAHVVAHDNAGLISLRGYLLHDLRYASLCLIDVVAIGPFGLPLFKTVADNPDHFNQLPDFAIEGILEGYIRSAAFSKIPEDIMRMLKAPWLTDGGKGRFIHELCQANYRSIEAVEARYGEVGQKLPVKVIWGAEDQLLPVETAWRLGKALGAREVAVIEKAGHLPMLDQGAQLGIELGTWLTALSLQ